MSDEERLAAALLEAELPDDSAVLVEPPTPDAPPPPTGPWVVVPWQGSYVVGGYGRGQFVAYGAAPDLDAAIALVVRLVGEPGASRTTPDEDALRTRGEQTAAAVHERARTRGGQAGTAMLEPGDVLDLVGPETGHHLYALGTPWPERCQPPTEIGGPYHRYEVLTAVPDATEGVAAPWFEQPGGGAMVVLQHPVRWYVDQGHLVELVEARPD